VKKIKSFSGTGGGKRENTKTHNLENTKSSKPKKKKRTPPPGQKQSEIEKLQKKGGLKYPLHYEGKLVKGDLKKDLNLGGGGGALSRLLKSQIEKKKRLPIVTSPGGKESWDLGSGGNDADVKGD